MEFKVCDVRGDGSCFIRAIYNSSKSVGAFKHVSKRLIKTYTPSITENEFVKEVRKSLQEIISTSKDKGIVKDIYQHLKTLDKASYDTMLDSTFPDWFVKYFSKLPSSEAAFREKLAKGASMKSHWVSEIEVTIIKALIETRSSWRLVVYNNNEQAKGTPKPRHIYIINEGEIHYKALIPRKVCSKKDTILNPQTNRCVKKTSCKGFELQLNTLNMSS